MRRPVVIAALLFHLCVAVAVYLAGRLALFPQLINAQGLMIDDSQTYQAQALLLSNILTGAGLSSWFFALLSIHVKLYSLCFALFGRVLGPSVLAIEPLNGALFLSVLYLVFKLGEEAFERRTGLLAAALVGLWPSFLLHTTQPLRDTLFVATALLFLLFNLRLLIKTYSTTSALGLASTGAVVECLLWLFRSEMWQVMTAIAFITCLMLALRMFREGRIFWGNATGAGLLLLVSLLIPPVAVRFYRPAYAWAKSRDVAFVAYNDAALNAETVSSGPQQIKAYLPARISALRERFIAQDGQAGSNIDTEARFNSNSDVVSYLPRAMVVGFFAPFPQMWFERGAATGRAGRLIGAAETVSLYLLELMALVGLWRGRAQLPAWLLFVAAVCGITALGLVVTNAGTLYRLRYFFVMMLVILASEGVRVLCRRAIVLS